MVSFKDIGARLNTLNARDYALLITFSALMAITTMFALPLPFGGLMHLGNIVMWTASVLFGGTIGGLAGGIGGMIVDLLEAPIWAAFTPFCKLASGLVCGLVAGDSTKVDNVKIVRIIVATIAGWLTNAIAYAPVYYLLLGPSATVAWLLLLTIPSPTLILNLTMPPILSTGTLKAYPGISAFRESARNRMNQYLKAKGGAKS